MTLLTNVTPINLIFKISVIKQKYIVHIRLITTDKNMFLVRNENQKVELKERDMIEIKIEIERRRQTERNQDSKRLRERQAKKDK